MPVSARQLREIAFALLAGALGGGLFAALGLPAPWLSGSMIAVAALSLTPLPMALPPVLSSAAFVLIGISMGTGFSTGMLDTAAKWPLSLLALALSIPVTIAAGAWFLRRHAGWDPATALFASVPGALSYVMAITLQSRADAKLVILAQMVRLMILMAVLPPLIVAMNEVPAGAASPAGGGLVPGPGALALLLAAGAAGGGLLHWLKVPAGFLLGAMLASAALQLTGVIAGRLPAAIVIPSLLVLGTVVGLRFRRASLAVLGRGLLPSLGAFVLAMAVAGLFSLAVSPALNLPLGQVLLAFSPGGLEVMMILSFLLGLDPAYVGMHQLARFLGLSLLLPLLARRHLARGAPTTAE